MRKKIRFPDMRNSLVRYLYDLSDIPFQKKKWVNPQDPGVFYWYFGQAINGVDRQGFFDNEGMTWIAYTLRTKEEVKKISAVAVLIDEVLETVGRYQPDSAYLTSPLWPKLAQAAKEAFELCTANDAACGYIPHFPYTHETA